MYIYIKYHLHGLKQILNINVSLIHTYNHIYFYFHACHQIVYRQFDFKRITKLTFRHMLFPVITAMQIKYILRS